MASKYSRVKNNTTNYVHPNEEHLLNLHHSMRYNPYGRPVLRIDDETVQHTSRNRRKVSTHKQAFILLAATVASNKDVFASLSWVEIR